VVSFFWKNRDAIGIQKFREIWVAVATEQIEQWREGYNSGNASKVAALYKEDAYYLTQHFITGIIKRRAAIQAYVQIGVDSKYHIDSTHALSLDVPEILPMR
jgi:hypothetical protein